MKREAPFVSALVLTIVLYSCQSSIGIQTTGVPSSSITLSPTAVPTSTPLGPFVQVQNQNIILKSQFGEYIVYDVTENHSYSIALPVGCRVSEKAFSAVCQTGSDFVSIDLATGEQTELPISTSYRWTVSSSGEWIYYYNSQDGNTFDLYRYAMQLGIVEYLATVNSQEWSLFPKVSDPGNLIVGARYGEELGYVSELYEIIPGGTYHRIGQNIDWSITDLAWSPTGKLLGVGATEVVYTDIALCTTTWFLTYDVNTGQSRPVAHAPTGTCYDYFDQYAGDIWSPDGVKVVLMANQELCILNIETESQNCLSVALPGESIDQVSWSPDSQYLAYILDRAGPGHFELLMISLDGSSQVSLLDNIPVGSDIVDMVWTKALP